MALTLIGIFILIVGIFILRKNKKDKNKNIEFFLWFFLIIAILMLFFRLAGEERPGPKEKQLNIKTTTKELCFYIDSFDGIDNFLVSSIKFDKMSRDKYEKIFVDSGFVKKPLSSIVGINRCLKYEANNYFELHHEKTLNIDSIYVASVYATNKNLAPMKVDTRNNIEFIVYFYLYQNPKTHTLEAVILDSRDDVNIWKNTKK